MPRLHKYVSRDAHYVLTSIDGSVVTYQLTATGEQRLAGAGIVAGQRFERALLLDLYRTGDAYAKGHEFPEAVLANQLALDFAGDPNPESAFPVCDACRSPSDLHLTLRGEATGFTAELLCPVCRAKPAQHADTSIPVALLSRTLLSSLYASKPVAAKAANVQRHESLLDAAFTQRWDAVRAQRTTVQSQLFGDGDLGGLGLG
ncbi:hypothetical protein [Gemmatimonas sp.]|jgi:hypothetical protein|uniref:hypothetical protein n=1 Tax=Gemmatimonas sp. TaxID=1962908 RepID=UPI0037C1A626